MALDLAIEYYFVCSISASPLTRHPGPQNVHILLPWSVAVLWNPRWSIGEFIRILASTGWAARTQLDILKHCHTTVKPIAVYFPRNCITKVQKSQELHWFSPQHLIPTESRMKRDLVLKVHRLDLTWHTNSWDVFLSGWRTLILGCVEQLNIIGFEESADMRGSLWVRVCVLINRGRWLELSPRLFSQQNWATNTTFPSSRARSPREEMRRWALERRWDETLWNNENKKCRQRWFRGMTDFAGRGCSLLFLLLLPLFIIFSDNQ